ncbi:hypothetical protein F0562_018694 [Nyssa sinensis]|uniref:AN1-type domain-containing protein n=1 Tax=Nyssa sinensis TaxID=561372 RepID=A0A5J4ZAS0_9ASTE|nr:hypothetical protein F0562_018694 [Nyssa sinensis]
MEGGGSEGEKKKPPEGENKVKRKMKTALQLEILEKTYAVETYPLESLRADQSRTENEETEFKVVPETITLCVNNCGFTGNPATKNMCQKCFNATTTITSASSSTAGILSPPLKFSGGEKSPRSSLSRSPDRSSDPEESSRNPTTQARMATSEEKEINAAKRVVSRCSGCRRRVGLTGFRCRCGELFCSEHRYSDRHDCSYDYKAAGREAIARENPVVKAAKIIRV